MWNDKPDGYPIHAQNPTGTSTGMNFYPWVRVRVQISTRSLFTDGRVIALPDPNPTRCHPYSLTALSILKMGKMGTVHPSNGFPIRATKCRSARSSFKSAGSLSSLPSKAANLGVPRVCTGWTSGGQQAAGGRADRRRSTALGEGRRISANNWTTSSMDGPQSSAEVGRISTARAALEGGAIWGRRRSAADGGARRRGEAVRGGAIWGRCSGTLLDSPHLHPRRAPTLSGCGSGVCWGRPKRGFLAPPPCTETLPSSRN
jgi:hypothetical protein